MASKRTVTIKLKAEILSKLKNGALHADLCKEYNVPHSTISTIWRTRDKILQRFGSKSLKIKKIPKSTHQDVEGALLVWFKAQRSQNVPLSGRLLQEKANHFARLLGKIDFECSRYWIERFRQRHDIVVDKVCGEAASVSHSDIDSQVITTSNSTDDEIVETVIPIPTPATHDEENEEEEDSKEEEPKKPVERTCHSCKQTWFWGFVYRCLQCEFVHCAKCDAAGVHSEHYVLRVPSARPKKEEEAVMCKIWDAVNSCPFPPSATEHALLEQTGRVEPPAGSRGDQANSDTDDASANEQEEVEVKLEFEATEHDPLAAASAPALAEVPRPGVRVTQVHAPVVESTAGMQLAPEFFTSQVNLGMMIFKDEPPDYDEPCASTSDLPSTSHASLGDHTYFETHKKKETVPAKRKNDKNIESRQPKARRGRPRKKKIDTDQD